MATPTSLPAAFTSGQILTATNMNDIRGAFRVLQVLHATTTTGAANSTNVYADTGLSLSITPSATTNKILVFVTQAGCGKNAGSAGSALQLRLVRGSTELVSFENLAGYTNTSSINYIGSISCSYLDSPATTSSTTYKTQFRNVTNAASVEVQANGGSASSITLMEISA